MLTPGQKLSSIVLRLIHSPGGIPVNDIKEEYDLSDRTFRNYVKELQNIPELFDSDGMPLIVVEKEGDCRCLRLRNPAISDENRTTFFASFYMASSIMNFLSGTGFYAPIENWKRVMRNDGFRLQIRHLEKKLFALNEWPKDYSGKDAIIRAVLKGVLDQRKIDILYKSRNGNQPKWRKGFKPFTLMEYRSGLYVVGEDADRKADYIYLSIDRIENARLLQASFHYPPNYSPQDFTRNSFGLFKGGVTYQVVLEFHAGVASLVKERKYHESAVFTQKKNGNLILSMMVNALEQMLPWVLSFGPLVTVIKPGELIARVTSDLSKALKAYTE